jgi:hypothetical protein
MKRASSDSRAAHRYPFISAPNAGTDLLRTAIDVAHPKRVGQCVMPLHNPARPRCIFVVSSLSLSSGASRPEVGAIASGGDA